MRKKNLVVVVSVSLAAFLTGCGNRSSTITSASQVGTQRGGVIASGTPATPAAIPQNKSVHSVNPALVGQFVYGRTACQDSSGNSIPQPYMKSETNEKIIITDRTLTDIYDDGSGCPVTYQYDILGVDSKVIVLNNVRVSIASNGDQCPASQWTSTDASQTYTFNYQLGYDGMLGSNSLSLLTPPTGSCQADEKTQDLYRKL